MPRAAISTGPARHHARRRLVHRRGGAALEYILVSTFAAVVGMAALAFIGRMVEQQLMHMAERVGFDETPDLGNPFDE